MKPLFIVLSLIVSFAAYAGRVTTQASGWTACNTNRKGITVTQSSGDIATVAFPGPKTRPSYLSFLTTETMSGDFNDRTISATFHVSTTGSPVYGIGYSGGCPTLANLGIYFTTTTGFYWLNDADTHPRRYWWAGPTRVSVQDVDDGQNWTISVSTDNLSQWSDANGEQAATIPGDFITAASMVAQIGLSFGGGCFFDTGVNVTGGTAIFHLVSFTVQ